MKVKVVSIAIVIFLIVLIIASYILLRDFFEYKQSIDSNSRLIEEVVIEENQAKESEIDWEKIEDINKDIIGWIKIENTNINYPILKDDSSLKYLNHSFEGKYNSNGSIFTLNDNPFVEETTIYGHNMKNKNMFSELEKYMNEDFFKQHNTFEIYTKEQNYRAKIFSFYSINVYEEQENIRLLQFKERIEYYKKKSIYHIENIGEAEKIVKLSTCSYLNNYSNPTTERYYLIAKIESID